MAIFDVKLHILPHGYRFNLKTFKPLLPETQAEGKAKQAESAILQGIEDVKRER